MASAILRLPPTVVDRSENFIEGTAAGGLFCGIVDMGSIVIFVSGLCHRYVIGKKFAVTFNCSVSAIAPSNKFDCPPFTVCLLE